MTEANDSYCENDPLPISDIKKAKNFFKVQEIYLKIINNSLLNCVFPESEKLACIKPAYKNKGDRNDLNSYRPISNLSYLSKLIEIAVNKQLCVHLNETGVIPENQSAYRKNHSTETAICSVINDMIGLIDNGKCEIVGHVQLHPGLLPRREQ